MEVWRLAIAAGSSVQGRNCTRRWRRCSGKAECGERCHSLSGLPALIEARLKRARILDAGDRMVVETVTRGGMLAMPEIGVEIPIDEVYRGVEPEGGD